MFTKWRKVGALAVTVLSIIIFTITTNVVFKSASVWADTSEMYEEEPGETSSDTVGSSSGFFSGIINWVNGVTGAINKMWGMENGSGVAMVVNGVFYLFLIVGTLFVGKLLFNIINETVNRKVDEKYEKPSFRKK